MPLTSIPQSELTVCDLTNPRTMILLPPKFFFGVENADTHIERAKSPDLVQCSGLLPSAAVAISPKVALAHGCTR